MFAIRLKAPHTPRSNPKRAFVVFENERLIDAIDEGYEGTGALRRHYPAGMPVLADFETTNKEYKELLKWARENEKTGWREWEPPI